MVDSRIAIGLKNWHVTGTSTFVSLTKNFKPVPLSNMIHIRIRLCNNNYKPNIILKMITSLFANVNHNSCIVVSFFLMFYRIRRGDSKWMKNNRKSPFMSCRVSSA